MCCLFQCFTGTWDIQLFWLKTEWYSNNNINEVHCVIVSDWSFCEGYWALRSKRMFAYIIEKESKFYVRFATCCVGAYIWWFPILKCARIVSCWLGGVWAEQLSLHADIGILVDTDVEPLEHQHCLGMEVPLQPWLDCRIPAGLRNGYSGRGYQCCFPLVASLVQRKVFLRKFARLYFSWIFYKYVTRQWDDRLLVELIVMALWKLTNY